MSMLLALLTGAIISVMVAVNGQLKACVGTYLAAVIIHIVGTIFSYILCRVKKTPIFRREGLPFWVYLGGVIGVLTTIFNASAFGHISMTSIVALGLLGQSAAAASWGCRSGIWARKPGSVLRSPAWASRSCWMPPSRRR